MIGNWKLRRIIREVNSHFIGGDAHKEGKRKSRFLPPSDLNRKIERRKTKKHPREEKPTKKKSESYERKRVNKISSKRKKKTGKYSKSINLNQTFCCYRLKVGSFWIEIGFDGFEPGNGRIIWIISGKRRRGARLSDPIQRNMQRITEKHRQNKNTQKPPLGDASAAHRPPGATAAAAAAALPAACSYCPMRDMLILCKWDARPCVAPVCVGVYRCVSLIEYSRWYNGCTLMDPHTPPTPFSLLSSLLPPLPFSIEGGGRRRGFLIPALNCHIILVGVWRWLEGRWGGMGG